MPDRDDVISHMQIMHTWAEFALEHGINFFEMEHIKRIAKWTEDALELLKEQEPSEWVEDSDPGQKYGTTWACFKCGKSIHKPFIWNPYDSNLRYCPFCGRRMKQNA